MNFNDLVNTAYMQVGRYYKIKFAADKRATEFTEVLARCVREYRRFYVVITQRGYTLCVQKQDLLCGNMYARLFYGMC